MNTAQGNCEKKILFNDKECPKDLTGSTGTLINHLLSFTCEIKIFEICTFDAVRSYILVGFPYDSGELTHILIDRIVGDAGQLSLLPVWASHSLRSQLGVAGLTHRFV